MAFVCGNEANEQLKAIASELNGIASIGRDTKESEFAPPCECGRNMV